MFGQDSYTLDWSIRGWLYSMMHQQGRQRLRQVNDANVNEFLTTFPDQKSMCQRFLGPCWATLTSTK